MHPLILLTLHPPRSSVSLLSRNFFTSKEQLAALNLSLFLTFKLTFKAPLRELLISSMCIKNFKYKGGDELNFKEVSVLIRILDQSHCWLFTSDRKYELCQYFCLPSASIHTSPSSAWRLNRAHMGWLWVVGALNG